MGFSWTRENPPHWDENKAKVVGGAPVDSQLIWLNTSQSSENVDGNPLVDGQPLTVDLGVLPEATEVVFFLIAYGWRDGANRALS